MDVDVRAARPGDPVPELLFLSAAPYYAAFAGGADHAGRSWHGSTPAAGTPRAGRSAASRSSATPSPACSPPSRPTRGDELARRFVRMTLARTPPWRLPALVRHLHATAVIAPHPPRGVLYVDALATHPDFRRRGVATALLGEADRMAARAGLPRVALDTGIENRAARRSTSAAASPAAGCGRRRASGSPAPSAAPASSATSGSAGTSPVRRGGARVSYDDPRPMGRPARGAAPRS